MSDYNCNGFSVRSQKYAVIEKEAIQCHSHISLVKFASTNNVGEPTLAIASHISISNDKFHTNQYIIEANTFLNNYGFDYNIGGTSQDTEDTLLPLGNAQDIYNLYSFGVCYCHNPQHQYSFMIDETGDIYKCSFGVLQYDNIQNFTSGGFAARFKEFNKKFYHIFLPSCTSCIRYCTTENAIAPNN